MSENSFGAEGHARGRRARVRDLPPGRAAAALRRRPAAVLAQGPAREPAAHRGQRLGHAPPTSRRSPSWDAKAEPSKEIAFTPARVLMQDFTGVPAVVDLAAMRDAMAEMGGDPAQDQPAGAGRAGDRPLGPGRRVRHARRLPRQRRARVRAQPGALRVPALGPGRLRRLRGRAAGHRDRPPGQPRVPRARRLRSARTTPIGSGSPRRPTRTRSSAPTRTRRWSTASACSAGASAGSRPRRRCSASRCRC